jgi:hypothetical protein
VKELIDEVWELDNSASLNNQKCFKEKNNFDEKIV